MCEDSHSDYLLYLNLLSLKLEENLKSDKVKTFGLQIKENLPRML